MLYNIVAVPLRVNGRRATRADRAAQGRADWEPAATGPTKRR